MPARIVRLKNSQADLVTSDFLRKPNVQMRVRPGCLGSGVPVIVRWASSPPVAGVVADGAALPG